MVGTSEDRVDILQEMTSLMLEHLYDNRSSFDDGSFTLPRVLSPSHNVEGSEASAVYT